VLSPLSAVRAEKLGYKNVKVFHAGMPAWKKAGHPIVSNTANLEYLNKVDASYILLDLRPAAAVEKGHIPTAVAAADGKVDGLKDQFPSYKKAIIILYNEDGNLASAKEAYKKITDWGYKQVSILKGGYKAWDTPKRRVVKGPAASTIKYVRKLLPGEIEMSEFKKLVGKAGAETIIIDTRTVDEFHACGLPYAFNIPLELIESRVEDLPRDKPLVLYCNSGVRAQMGYSLLKKAGFQVKYLNSIVQMERVDPAKCIIK
jgi:rhodanese-related sulfurtransferase